MATNFSINKVTLDNNSNSTEILTGSGNPNGIISANAGSLFLDALGNLYIGQGGTVWALAAAGGTLNHASLTNLGWTVSAHTGTAGSIAIFDNLGAAAEITGVQGDVIYFDGSNWNRLPAGTSGQFLQTQGAGADPQWAASSGEQVKVSANDTTAGYLFDKIITATAGVAFTEINDGADEDLRLDINSASTSGQGLIEIATQAEVNAGVSTSLAVVPASLANATTVARSLQTAYDLGNIIVTAGSTNIGFALNSGGLNIQGSDFVTIGSTTEVSSFSVFSSGTVTAQGRDTFLIDMQANDAANKTLTISASNAGAGSGNIAISADGISVSSDTFGLDFTTSAIITDSAVGEGLKYAADYSSTFIDESLVTKRFVDDGFVAINQVNGVVYVDAVEGDDGTGAAYRTDKPFLTIAAAISASAAGDTIMIRPGTYAEWGITVPANRTVRGEGSWQTVTVGSTAATSDVFTIATDVTITDLTIQLATAAHDGISFTGVAATDTGGIYNLRFLGDGVSGAARGIYKDGPGKIIGAEIRWDLGGFDAGMQSDGGTIALESLHFPPSAGSINAAARGFDSGRLQLADMNVGNSNVVYGLDADATNSPTLNTLAPTILVYGVNFFNLENAVRINCDGAFIGLYAGKVQDQFFDFVINPGCDGFNAAGTRTAVQSTAALQSKFNFPFAALASDFALNYLQEETATNRAASILLGGDLVAGFPELGSNFWSGTGRPYNLGATFLTTDNTASPVSNGANFVDETIALSSTSGSTATFQGSTAGHSILWTVSRQDVSGNYLKYFGYEIAQDVAGVGGEYVFEIQTAANTWTEVSVEALSKMENYRYSSSVFIRGSSEENIIMGIDGTAWPSTTINGVVGRWARVRIVTAVTTLPTFEQIKLISTSTNLNDNGYRSVFGLAQWTRSVSAVGNVFSESGSVTNSTTLVGTGAGSWTHVIQNSDLDNTTKFVDTQIIIPNGICTAYPLFVSIYYYTKEASGGGGGTSAVTAPCEFMVDAIAKEVTGILVADPAGGIAPIARTYASTELINTGTPFSQTQNASNIGDIIAQGGGNDNRTRKLTFGPIPIDNYYEGDVVYFRGIITNQGAPSQAVIILGVDIEGTAFSDGRPIE